MYSIMGDILRVRKVQNKVTEETLVQLQVSCNDIPFTVQINEKDLYGEPLPGRRSGCAGVNKNCMNPIKGHAHQA